MPRKYLYLALAAAALGIAVATYLVMNLDSLIRRAVTEFAPRYTLTSVSIDRVSVGYEGEGVLTGLVIGSPQGFQAAQTLKVAKINLAIDAQSLTQPVIIIRKLEIDGLDITLEKGPEGKTNLQQVLDNVQAAVEQNKREAERLGILKAKGQEVEDKAPPKRFIVERLSIEKAKIGYQTDLRGTPFTGSLPTLRFKDLGKNSGGAPADQLLGEVLGQVNDQTITALGKGVIDEAVSGAAALGQRLKQGIQNLGK